MKETTYYSIDRFENNIAILINDKDGSSLNIPSNQIQSGAKEGDILYLKDNKYLIDKQKTDQARDEINKLLKNLF